MIEAIKKFFCSLCPPCCSNCPNVFIFKDGTIGITDDFSGEIRITKKQFKALIRKYDRAQRKGTLKDGYIFIEDCSGGEIKITKEQLNILKKKYDEILNAIT